MWENVKRLIYPLFLCVIFSSISDTKCNTDSNSSSSNSIYGNASSRYAWLALYFIFHHNFMPAFCVIDFPLRFFFLFSNMICVKIYACT